MEQDYKLSTDRGNQKPEGEYTTSSRKSKFRFKSSTRDRDRSRSPHKSRSSRSPRSSGESRHRHHHRTKRFIRSPSPQDDSIKDPDVAFRESLFDAMADDEGAQFWEGVYGQPIHTYPDVKEGPQGELERMTDEEYTAFVRAKMYEKTHQHLIEEKARRDAANKERERLAKEGRREEREAEKFRKKVEESLKRGEERKSRKAWSDRWIAYTTKWERLAQENATTNVAIASIPWPVESGKRKDIELKEVERFFLYAPTAGQPTESQLAKVLKQERVRWHPDKIQQKLGGQDVDDTVIQAVTEVFQVIDRMWSELRDGSSKK